MKDYLVVAIPVFLLAGCVTTTNMRLGERAERQGRYHLAYEYYCDEANQGPSRGVLQAAIGRVAPRAAEFYQRQGDRAAVAEQYADAWKLYMRALAITPDSTGLVRIIRVLEHDHPDEIAPAKADWTEYGEKALTVASYDSPSRDHPPAPATAMEDEVDEGFPRRIVRSAEAHRDAQDGPGEIGAEAHDSAGDRTAAPGSGAPKTAPEAATPGPDAGYLTTVILSVEDRRFPRKTHLVDDIHVKLKDTDDDPDADLDIYLGSKRVKKARDLKTGESVRVRGRSGKYYEVVLIAIVDRTESVRLGVRARPKPVGQAF